MLSWNNILDSKTRNSNNIEIFKTKVKSLFKPKKNELYGLLDKEGIRRLTQLRVDLNPLKYYKFMHNFLDTNDPMCLLNDGIENCEHFLLDCGLHVLHRTVLLNNVSLVTGFDVNTFSRVRTVNILLFGDNIFSDDSNKSILQETIKFINASGIYKEPHV